MKSDIFNLIKEIEDLGLENITSKVQYKRGVLAFHDPQANCEYISYQNGYIRRKVITRNFFTNNLQFRIYQLNSVKKEKHYNPKYDYTYTSTKRIMIENPESRLLRIIQIIPKHRKYYLKINPSLQIQY